MVWYAPGARWRHGRRGRRAWRAHLGLKDGGRRRVVQQAAVDLIQPLGAVAGADRHRVNGPACLRSGGKNRHWAGPRREEARPTPPPSGAGKPRIPPLTMLAATGSGEGHRSGKAHRVDCVRIVHKHRNLLSHAPEKLHDEITADYTDMIYADSAAAIETRRRAFLRKWRLKCPAGSRGKTPGTQVQHALATVMVSAEIRHFSSAEPGSIRASPIFARGFAPLIPDPADRLSRMDRPPLGALDHRHADQPDPVLPQAAVAN